MTTGEWIHYLVLLVHVFAGVFWLGWMVFIFFLLSPVLREEIPERARGLLTSLKERIRKVVFWLILIILATGLHNAYYNGLHRFEYLFGTDYGHRFLMKLVAVLILFSVYFTAPYLTSGTESDSEPVTMIVVLHVLAFGSGTVAAFIGLTL